MVPVKSKCTIQIAYRITQVKRNVVPGKKKKENPLNLQELKQNHYYKPVNLNQKPKLFY